MTAQVLVIGLAVAALFALYVLFHGPYRRRLAGRLKAERDEAAEWAEWLRAMRETA